MAKIYKLNKEDLKAFSKELRRERRFRTNLILLIVILIFFITIIIVSNWPIPYRDYIPDSSYESATQSSEEN